MIDIESSLLYVIIFLEESQETFTIKKISSKRSIVKVFSAHMVKSVDNVEKASDRSEESDTDMSPRISPETSITGICCLLTWFMLQVNISSLRIDLIFDTFVSKS